jgi:biopolymer transport protein ExbD
MKKIKKIICALLFISIAGCCLNNECNREDLDYASTDITPPFIKRDPRALNVKILKDGTIKVEDKVIPIKELKIIVQKAFDKYEKDLPILIHTDKNTSMRHIKPIIKGVLNAGGIRIKFVTKNKSPLSYYYFAVDINDKYFKEQYTIELSKSEIKFNNRSSNLVVIKRFSDYYLDTNFKIICEEDVLCQRLIDVLTQCQFSNVLLKIKENANKKNSE